MRSLIQRAVVFPITNITREEPDENKLADPELIISS
jgi:hypothetical protein